MNIQDPIVLGFAFGDGWTNLWTGLSVIFRIYGPNRIWWGTGTQFLEDYA